MRRVCATVVLLCLSTTVWAQSDPPVVRAKSRVATIVDGHHVKKDFWYIMPERNPDLYYVEVPLEPHTVTFTTDVESISFGVAYGSRHAFVVELVDGKRAHTEIRTEFRHLLRSEATGTPPALIPFTLGDNDKIYIQGRLNGGPAMSLQFDLGAGGSLVKKASVPKANLTFDGTITLRNSDGVNEVPSSSRNRLEIAGMVWRDVPFAVADNMTHREDGIVGNSLFQDKVVEIDYQRMALVVHASRPPLATDWRRQNLVLDGNVVPFARGAVAVGGTEQEGWFMLDTGAYTSILNSSRLSATSKMRNEFRRLLGPLRGRGSDVELSIGGERFADVNYSARAYDGNASSLGLLGNDVLKRFNIIIDNRAGLVFLRPNHHRSAPYRNPERIVARVSAIVIVAALVTLGWRIRARRSHSSSPASGKRTREPQAS